MIAFLPTKATGNLAGKLAARCQAPPNFDQPHRSGADRIFRQSRSVPKQFVEDGPQQRWNVASRIPSAYDRRNMPKDDDRSEAKRVIRELRESAGRLIKRSRELAAEALRLKQRADDLDQLIRQREMRDRK
jgi:hypothetical protein